MRTAATVIAILASTSIALANPNEESEKDYAIYKPTQLSDTTLVRTSSEPIYLGELAVEARCRVPGDNPRQKGNSPTSWSLGWSNGDSAVCEVEIRRVTDYIDDISGGRRLHIRATRRWPGGMTDVAEADLIKDVDLNGGYNTLLLSATSGSTSQEASVSVSIGSGELHETMTFTAPMPQASSNCFMRVDGLVESRLFVVERTYDRSRQLQSTLDVNMLLSGEGMQNSDIDGLWEYLDRENDNDYARPGGFYHLATVTDTESGIVRIIYLDGAEVSDHLWQPGMIKGTLRPTIFTGNYDLTWNDAHMRNVASEMYATLSDDHALLTLCFPELKTKLRFRRVMPTGSKMPKDK